MDGQVESYLNGWQGDINFKTKNGKPLTLSNVYLLLKNTFYYGKFEYPKGSAAVVQVGKHEPIITKDLYNQAQDKISKRPSNKNAK
jgi:hypothetical protein